MGFSNEATKETFVAAVRETIWTFEDYTSTSVSSREDSVEKVNSLVRSSSVMGCLNDEKK